MIKNDFNFCRAIDVRDVSGLGEGGVKVRENACVGKQIRS